MSDFGYCEGDTCARDGCEGIIELEPVKDCSCHISAPCWNHENTDMHCPDCGWRAADDPLCVREIETISLGVLPYIQTKPRVLDPTKIDWVAKLHTASSMIKEGVFPVGTSAKDVEDKVRGTFGGRFSMFDKEHGRFKYIAYTD
ncbi:hypothetical protein C4K38_2135 [Pseudomonas chlororaphis subsp. piscium]|uniref:hypothetical protein n=1 Tax=Pseudomonas chlororaphis TaxID=587753 RepID=UPI0006A60B6A|nr:hypothetical protein [Pseudomonas chlororaphis]AZC30095.1 hypothetical protein C4K38_2135 [Pseudomonas chlororaphis subsp. piscium]WDG94024.1 hypothetical protein PUP49_11560 [Pseudomonas chlororaphis]SDT25069.1 hypothetical protein SAMN05216585_5243 [Pseudomonas chlororaphis]